MQGMDKLLLADTEPETFRFDVLTNPEPDSWDGQYTVLVIALPGAAWPVETIHDRFVTGDPGGFIAAFEERLAMPDLEDRLNYYAEMGW